MKWLKVLLVLVAAVAIAGYIGLFFLPYFLGQKVERELAAIEAQGHPVRLSDLIPDIPDEENAALIYAQAFEIIDDPSAKKELEAAFDLLNHEKRQEHPELWAEARQAASRYREALAVCERAASRPKCRFPVKWEDGIDAKLPHLSKIRNLFRLATLTALVEAREGRMDQSARYLGLGYEIGESLRDEPSIIAQSARSACAGAMSRALRDCLEYGRFGQSDLQMLSGILMSLDPLEGWRTALLGERVVGMDALERMRLDPATVADYSGCEFSAPKKRPGWFWQVRSYADELFYLSVMGRVVNMTARPYRDLQEDEKYDPRFPFYAIGTAILLPSIGRVFSERDYHIARVVGDRIMLALLAHKDRLGSYPQTLDDLRDELGWEIPEDPFSGKDFVYGPEGKGFLLYSVGRNLKDDRARPLPEEARKPVKVPLADKDLPPGMTAAEVVSIPEGYEYPSRGQLYADIVWRMDH